MSLTNTPYVSSRIQNIITVVVTETVVTLIIVIARVLVKLRMTKATLWWDDWLMILAMVMSILHGSYLLAQMPYGFGHHIFDLSSHVETWKAVKIFYFAQIDYFAIVGVIKMSILFFYIRLSRHLRPAIYALMVFLMGTHISCILVAIFQCTPIPFDWDESIKDGHCINRTAFYYSNAALNIVSDIIIYMLPMQTLWAVQIPRKQRIGLILVFAVGGFVVITGILRLKSLKSASVTKDPTWDNVPATLWTETEFNVGIVCGCLPCLKPLFMKALGHKGSSKSTSGVMSSHGGVVNHEFERYDLERSNSKVSNHSGLEAYETKVMGSVSAGTNDSAERINERFKGDDELGGIRKTTIVDVMHH